MHDTKIISIEVVKESRSVLTEFDDIVLVYAPFDT